jgi:hypothetical protein
MLAQLVQFAQFAQFAQVHPTHPQLPTTQSPSKPAVGSEEVAAAEFGAGCGRRLHDASCTLGMKASHTKETNLGRTTSPR